MCPMFTVYFPVNAKTLIQVIKLKRYHTINFVRKKTNTVRKPMPTLMVQVAQLPPTRTDDAPKPSDKNNVKMRNRDGRTLG